MIPSTITATFGFHDQTGPWTDVRELSWDDLSALLTDHREGPKHGACMVPARLRGGLRRKAEADAIEVAVLDSDAGYELDAIAAAIEGQGWAAIIHSTHSHGTTRLEIAKAPYERAVAEHGDGAAVRIMLEKGYLPRIAEGASVAAVNGVKVAINHPPCPKYRVVIPLARPWRAADHTDQETANTAWRDAVRALAAALGLTVDQSCTDTSRLFYLPRHAPGAPHEARVIRGEACDVWRLAPAPVPPVAAPLLPLIDRAPERPAFIDPTTGEVFDLARWAATHGRRFKLAAALRSRTPRVMTARVSEGRKHHTRCPNEAAHTIPGEDDATFVMDAATSDTGGFVVHCRHSHCEGRDRLHFVGLMLEQGWLSIADLTNSDYLLPDAVPVVTIGRDWPDPADLLGQSVEAAPEFPMDTLPGSFRAFVADIAERMQVRPDAVAIPLLIAAGTAIGKGFRLRPKAADDWSERPCLWGGVIGDPGSLKTPAFNAALSPLRRAQATMEAEHRLALEVHAAACDRAAQAELEWKRECKRTPDGVEKPARPEAAVAPPVPAMRRVLTGEATQEALVDLMDQNPRGMLMFRDELSGWFGSFNQYRPGGDRQFFLECHAGGQYIKDRKISGTVMLHDTYLSIVGGFQPDIVSKVLAGDNNDGMAARFSMLVWPETLSSFEYVDRQPDATAAAKVEAIFDRLLAMEPEAFFGPLGFNPSPALRFDDDGQIVFRDWYTGLMNRLRGEAMGGAMKAHLSKYPGLFARLAVVLHLVEHADEPKAAPCLVSAVTAERVRDFVTNYLERHAIRIYRHLGQDPARAGAQRIARWLKDSGTKEFAARDVRRKEWSGMAGQDAVNRALDYLEHVAGWIVCRDHAAGPKGGRPSTRYSVNPKIGQ